MVLRGALLGDLTAVRSVAPAARELYRLDAPADAQQFGFYNWRVTECFWREMPKAGARGAYFFTPAPVWNPIATCTAAQPDEDFFGWDGFSTEGACIRWYQVLRYPLGVRLKDGEDWYVNVHAPEVCKQPGLRRFFSYQCAQEARPAGRHVAPDATPPDDMQMVQWDRVVEMWYDSFAPGAKPSSTAAHVHTARMGHRPVLLRGHPSSRSSSRGWTSSAASSWSDRPTSSSATPATTCREEEPRRGGHPWL